MLREFVLRELRALTTKLHQLAPAEAPLMLAIDQEGGRVQRLRARERTAQQQLVADLRGGSRQCAHRSEEERAVLQLAELPVEEEAAPAL